jgi:hypothetical protein
MVRSLALFAAFWTLPCGGEAPSREAAESSSRAGETPSAVSSANVVEGADDQVPAVPEELEARMQDHFTAVTQIADAVVDGDLDAARETAVSFLEHRSEGLPPGWPEHVARMRDAAQRVVDADELDAAAAATGTMLASCGSCHVALGARPQFLPTHEPTPRDTAAGEMERHQWALARLSEGLIGPSDEMWLAGAERLVVSPVCATAAAKEVGDPVAVRKMAQRFDELAGRTRRTSELEGRGRLYGEMLSTCAACHRSGC